MAVIYPSMFYPYSKELRETLTEILKACAAWRGWLIVGWQQFVFQHRRALIGPFWQTINAAVWGLGIGLVFKGALHKGDPAYMSYIAAGIVTWNFIITCLVSGSNVFNVNANIILNLRIPLLTHTFRLIVFGIAKLLFQCFFLIPVLIFWGNGLSWNLLMVAPGLLLLVFTSAIVVPLMGIIGARFRDFPFAVQSCVRFLFFASPVFWKPDMLGTRAFMAHWNPITHYLAIVRDPLLNKTAPLFSWQVVLATTLILMLASFFLYHKSRDSIAYWL